MSSTPYGLVEKGINDCKIEFVTLVTNVPFTTFTQDLAGFWQNGYDAVRKELKGRYPKHYWPDDPLKAQATARVKPKKR